MSRLLSITASSLAAAALVPAVAGAHETNALRGTPHMHIVDLGTVAVDFTTDERIRTTRARVSVVNHGTAPRSMIQTIGRRGNDYRYRAVVNIRGNVTVGRKYTVRFRLDGGRTEQSAVLVRPGR